MSGDTWADTYAYTSNRLSPGSLCPVSFPERPIRNRRCSSGDAGNHTWNDFASAAATTISWNESADRSGSAFAPSLPPLARGATSSWCSACGFHAAGRHTHITELLRNGASLPEAKELSRHSDVKKTMRYTHIGIHDQSEALQRLTCQHIVSNSALSDCWPPSADGATERSENDTTPGETEGCDVSCQSLAGG